MTPFYSTLKSIIDSGLKPIIKKLNYFDDETLAYNDETELITLIGSNYIKEIKDGPLKNMLLTNNPPNHKGLSYEEIYGIERAIEEKEKRNVAQKLVGGFFKNHKHSKESKQKISDKVKGEKNPMFGKTHTTESKKMMSLKKQNKFIGQNNPNSKNYIVISPDNTEYKLCGNVEEFCKNNNLSYSTLCNTLYKNRPANRGKTKGWILKTI